MIDHLELVRRDLTDEAFAALSRADRVAWDIETSGLDWATDQIGTCQLYSVDTGTIVVQLHGHAVPLRLSKLLADPGVVKVFHHAPFDLRFMSAHWGVEPVNVACTKVASRLLNKDADSRMHSLQFLLGTVLGVELEKGAERVSDWSADHLSEAQIAYAARDVVYLLPLLENLEKDLLNQGLHDVYRKCLDFLPTRVRLETGAWPDVFAY